MNKRRFGVISGVRFFSLQPSFPLQRYIFRMWLFSFLMPTVLTALLILIAILVFEPSGLTGFAEGGPKPRSGGIQDKLTYCFTGMVYSPVFETFLLTITISLASRFRQTPNFIALICAGVFAIWHSLSWAPWGVLIFWPFYLMSRIYLVWRPRGYWLAWSVVALIHAAHNAVPALMAFAE